MNKLKCEIVRDLLPSYVDGLTSEVTSAAVDEHISGCEPCADILSRMRTPEENTRYDMAQVDYLKKVRSGSRRTAVFCSLAVLALALAVLLVKVFVIGSEVSPSLIYCSDISVSGNQLEMSGNVFDLGAYNIRVEAEESDGVVELDLRAVPGFGSARPVFDLSFLAQNDITEIRCGDLILWQNGTPISHNVSRLYAARNPYVGSMPANAQIANLLGIKNTLGDYTNTLHTAEEPYGWTITLNDPISQDDVETANGIMADYSCMLLALIDNLGYVTWEYTVYGTDTEKYTVDTAAAALLTGLDVKLCGDSAAALQLLDRALGRSIGVSADRGGFTLEVVVDTDCDIYGLALSSSLDGELFSTQGAQNADNSALVRGDVIMFDFLPQDFPSNTGLIDISQFSFDLSVCDETGSESTVCEGITLSQGLGSRFVMTLSGSYETGFSIE